MAEEQNAASVVSSYSHQFLILSPFQLCPYFNKFKGCFQGANGLWRMLWRCDKNLEKDGW
jgi:hypothetical protein